MAGTENEKKPPELDLNLEIDADLEALFQEQEGSGAEADDTLIYPPPSRLISFRCPMDLLERLPRPRSRPSRSSRIVNLLRAALEQQYQAATAALDEKLQIEELKDALRLFFQLFQRNAPHVDISEAEREKLKQILEMIK